MVKITEAMIERQICDLLTAKGYFVVKLKDQAACRSGSYQAGSPYQIKGVADLVCFLPDALTIWLEVKTQTGIQSQFQKSFEKRLKELGHLYFIVESAAEALEIVQGF